MAFQSVFKRYELKYIITKEQKNIIQTAMKPYMKSDKYGKTSIRNLYFDTDTYLLIRRSIEKPEYKEKLRIRSYSKATAESTVFVELKKKYKSIVYKRRIALPYEKAMNWIASKNSSTQKTQISSEIDYFLSYYKTLHPTVLLSYEREAFYSAESSDFRITFDENILVREDNLSLESDIYGTCILPKNTVLMEIKCTGGIPLWLTKILSNEKIYKISFSKYGTAYKNLIFPKLYSKSEKEKIFNV